MSDDVLKNTLADLKMYANVESSAIISNDGILVTSDMDPKFHPESFAAMASVVRKTALITMQTIGNHSINKLIVENRDGSKMITVCAGSKVMVTAMVNPDINMDSSLAEIIKAAATVKSYFD
ncbi:MAG: hypothetical protein P1P69_03540 [Methanosarcinaceae archaeon]|nr:hypothetical protein [Methanosarcinaceae archaeon]